jgi:hypothetical protein
MTATREARERWGEEWIEEMRHGYGCSDEQIDRVLADDDLWLVEPTQRFDALAGEKAIKAWKAAADFADSLAQAANRVDLFTDDAAMAMMWLMHDAEARASEAARRERERLEAARGQDCQ